MEINEALDSCVASLMAPSERLLAVAMRLSGDVSATTPAAIPTARTAPAGPLAGLPLPAGTDTRNRTVLANARAVLSETLGQIGLAKKD
ncbi:hypothetical protein [Teichococcus aestuarii]|uniref:hypothetical protein n=1 Tax=Teichococcus aestuarii TaxID=568898 RepID=UPI00361DD973